MRALLLVCSVLAACHAPRPPEVAAVPTAGLSIAVYRVEDMGYAVVDDRRWVEVRDGSLLLEDLDVTTPLATLVIEPIGASTLRIGTCARDLAVGSVRCAVSGPLGKHLVRVLYVTSSLGYGVQHDVTVASADRATIATRFSFRTPAWNRTAEVTLFEGIPGRDAVPLELAHGSLALDGTTSILAVPAREVPAQLRRVYSGELSTEDALSGTASDNHAVWLYLELEVARFPQGATHASLAVPGEDAREAELPDAAREQTATRVRLPLWIDSSLSGTRTQMNLSRRNADMQERFVFTVRNAALVPREVWVEQRLRDAKQRSVAYGTPKPTLGKQHARAKIMVAPNATVTVDFALAYVF